MDSEEHNLKMFYINLKEREKELNCIYQVENLLANKEPSTDFIFKKLIEIIPDGWQYPSITRVRINYAGKVFVSEGFKVTPWFIYSDIIVDNQVMGRVEVYYSQLIRVKNGTQFLPEEQNLLNAITIRLSNFIFFKRLEKSLKLMEEMPKNLKEIKSEDELIDDKHDEHWKWRLHMAQTIADHVDMQRFGVKAIYLIGSVKEANSGPSSDIDLMIHIDEDNDKRAMLLTWLEGWSLCLAEINYTRTGYKTNGLIDTHFISDLDIKNRTSFAVMIDNHTNNAKRLK